MSDLGDLLQAIRRPYIRTFEEIRAGARATGRNIIEEPALLDAAGEVFREGPLNIGMRLDLVIVEEGGAQEKISVDSDKLTMFEPAAFNHAGLEILLSPFQWDYVRLSTDGELSAVASALARWFDRAFAAEAPGPEGIGVVHFMSDPEHDGGSISCILDLGTAPVSALENLFDDLRDAGASRVELGPTQT